MSSRLFLVASLFASTSLFVGCSRQPVEQLPAPKPDSHDHVAGPHGGPLVEWGDLHIELIAETGGATAWILGPDAVAPAAIDSPILTLHWKGQTEAVEFRPSPVDKDPKGRSSRYVARHAAFGAGATMEGTISAVANGKPHTGDVKLAATAVDPKEAELFLKPGGAYTAADIQANGNVVPSVKYKGFHASHDIKPKPGDKLCPVTLTKANEKLTWIVGGKTYEFCCPPCLDEFVQLAKDQPAEIKDPGDYVKK